MLVVEAADEVELSLLLTRRPAIRWSPSLSVNGAQVPTFVAGEKANVIGSSLGAPAQWVSVSWYCATVQDVPASIAALQSFPLAHESLT